MGAHLPSNYSAVLVAALESRSPIPPRVSAICAIECIFTLAHCILLYSTLSLKGNWKNNPFKRGCDALSAPLHSVARKAKALTSLGPRGREGNLITAPPQSRPSAMRMRRHASLMSERGTNANANAIAIFSVISS